MNHIIVTTPEELRAIVSETVSQTLAGLTHTQKELPDNLTPRCRSRGIGAARILNLQSTLV